jgi:heme-degrading monooxygenase HmoA
MPVLEILQLKVKPNISPSDLAILTSLRTVRESLAQNIHPTHSRFYQSIEDQSLIYIIGLWTSLSQHHDFLSSPLRAEILSPQEHLLDFGWCVHIPVESMEDLPLEAPIIAIARITVKSGEHVKLHKEITARYRGLLEERTKPFGVVEGWRIDGEEEGEREQVIVTGWEKKEDHLAFGVGLRDHWDSAEASHMKDMER